MALVSGSRCRVFVGALDISNVVMSLEIDAAAAAVVTTRLVLAEMPAVETGEDGVVTFRLLQHGQAPQEPGGPPTMRGITLRADPSERGGP